MGGVQFCFLGDLKIQVLGAEIWELSAFVPQHPGQAPQKPDRSPSDQTPPAFFVQHCQAQKPCTSCHLRPWHSPMSTDPVALEPVGLSCMMAILERCSSLSVQGAEGSSAELTIKASSLLGSPEETSSSDA